ncbi:MAG: hypothetical protein COB24_01765 [Hyphomicrobiales bacterium]|nr:MAG: hypothetical protein COB24_01765 [Hyphomicrobiales bacterium]
MNNHQAENIAIAALQYIAAHETYFDHFLASSGMEAEQIKHAITTVDFQISILDFICLDESLLLSFCQTAEIEPAEPYKAFQYLSYHN